MRIAIVTPSAASARTGNRHTAQRYAAFLRDAGHRVRTASAWDGAECDLMIALHARKSSESIARFRARFPARPLIVVLTGTDLYRDIRVDAAARRSLEAATLLVTLQDMGELELARRLRPKVRTVYQSARVARRARPALPPGRRRPRSPSRRRRAHAGDGRGSDAPRTRRPALPLDRRRGAFARTRVARGEPSPRGELENGGRRERGVRGRARRRSGARLAYPRQRRDARPGLSRLLPARRRARARASDRPRPHRPDVLPPAEGGRRRPAAALRAGRRTAGGARGRARGAPAHCGSDGKSAPCSPLSSTRTGAKLRRYISHGPKRCNSSRCSGVG